MFVYVSTYCFIIAYINPIQDGYFWDCSRMRGQKDPPSLKSVTQSCKDETWHSYTLAKKDPKYI